MPNEFFQTVLKSLIAALVLLGLTWLAGKKKSSDLSLFQFASLVAVASAAALFALGAGYLEGITAILIIALVVFLAAIIPERIKQNKTATGFRPAGRLKKSKGPQVPPVRPFAPRPRGGLALNIIIDGKIIQTHLSIAEKDINWILDELRSQNLSVKDVMLAYFDADDQFFVHTFNR